MKLQVHNGKVAPVSFFKFVFVGHAVGLTLLFLPMFVLVAIFGSFTPVETESGGYVPIWLMPLMVPVIAVGQALVIGGLVTLGLWLYTRRREITLKR